LIRNSQGAGNLRVTLGRCRQVELHDRRQEYRVRHAVGDVELTAQRIGQRVHRRGIHGPQAEPAIQAGEGHPLARLHIVPMGDGTLQIAARQADAFQGVQIDHRVREAVHVGFDAVNQRVHAGRGRDGRRDRARQGGIDVSGIGNQVRAHDALLEVLSDVEQDGVRGHFAAGSRSGWQAHQPGAPAPDLADAEHVAHVLRAVQQHAQEFAGVQGAPAANADQRIGGGGLRRGERLLVRRDGRLVHHTIIHRDLRTSSPEGLRQGGH